MTQEPTEREIALGKRVEELETQAARPQLGGGGVIASTVNALSHRTPKFLLQVIVLGAMAYWGYEFFQRAQQLAFETQKLEAESASKATQADAMRASINGESLAIKAMRAEIAQTTAAADAARAEADAQGKVIDGASMQLRRLQAEIQNAEAEAAKANAELDAAQQIVNETSPLAVEQKRAEVESLEAEANTLLNSARTFVQLWKEPAQHPDGAFGGAFGNSAISNMLFPKQR